MISLPRQRFVRSAVFKDVFGVLNVAFAFQDVASKLCFRDKSQLKWQFWWMGVCSERVEIIPACGVVQILLKLT